MPRKDKSGDAPAAKGVDVSNIQMNQDLAALLSAKIREFEKGAVEENTKTEKLHSKNAKQVAKSKLKEANKILEDDMTGPQKVAKLWEKLQAEQELAETTSISSSKKRNEIAEIEADYSTNQDELTHALGIKGKLDSLCRQLQQQTNALVDERRRISDTERRRRQELADEFQHTIGDVKKTMDQQAQERSCLARENEELRSRFKKFFEEYDSWEKDRQEQQKTGDIEIQVAERKLAEQLQLYRQDAGKESTATRDNDELKNAEKTLRGQLQTYTSKFSNFQEALSKSDKVLAQYKRQRNKMQRRVEVLEKENSMLKSKNEKKSTSLAKEKDGLVKEKEVLQEKCKSLQAERQKILNQIQAEQTAAAA